MLGRLLVLVGTAVASGSAAASSTAPQQESAAIGSLVQSMALPSRQSQSSRHLQENWVICQLAGGTLDDADGKCRRCPCLLYTSDAADE